MDCTTCGAPLRPTDHFCRKCGAPAGGSANTAPPKGGPAVGGGTWTCSACGAETPDDRRFCQICGTPEAPAPSATVLAPSTSQPRTLTSPAPAVSVVPAAAAPDATRICAHCGSDLVPDSQFCNTCGAPLPVADERLYCAACGQELPEGAAFCNVCGAAAPPSPPTDSDDGPSAGGGRSAKKLILIGVIAVLVVAALGVAGVMFLPGLLDSGPVPPTLAEQVATVMGPVVTTNTEFRAAVKDLRPNGPNVISLTRQRLRVCDQKGRALRLALSDATTKLTAPPAENAPVATAAETAAKESLLTAFKANKALVQSIQSLPADPLRLTQGMVGQCRNAAGDTERAYSDATAKFAALQPTYALPAVAVTRDMTQRLMLTAGRMARERTFVAYVEAVNQVLGAAGSGRSTASEAVAGTADDCRIEPDEAAGMMSSAIGSRQSSLSSAQSIDTPSDPRVQPVQSALVESFELSQHADEQYLLWIQDVGEYFYSPPEGLQGKDPTKDFNYYDQAEALSASAGSAKERLCSLLNKYNVKYDAGSHWSSSDF